MAVAVVLAGGSGTRCQEVRKTERYRGNPAGGAPLLVGKRFREPL